MTKLYKVEVEYEVYVLAESARRAEELAEAADYLERGDVNSSWATEVQSNHDILPEWKDALPINSGKSTNPDYLSCEELLNKLRENK